MIVSQGKETQKIWEESKEILASLGRYAIIRFAYYYQEETDMPRENILFRCSVCGEENYIGTRNKRKHTEKMEIKKYCPRCNKKTVHKEKK